MTTAPLNDDRRTPAPEVFRELLQLLGGYRVSQALYVVAQLGIGDLLEDGPRTVDELAAATETHAPTLLLVLRFLAGVGVVSAEGAASFSRTPLSDGLRSDIPGSVRATVLMLLDGSTWAPWGHLLHSLRTGETAFDHAHGMGRFAYLAEHPDTAATFNAAMSSDTAQSGDSILRYDFSDITKLVDVGGGHGLLLATVLRANPHLQGAVFDRPAVVAGTPATLAAAGVAERGEAVAGDFFESVPAGGDAYLLRQIIHDWDDQRAESILANCRRVMPNSGRILVVERRIAADYREALPVLHLDLQMLVNVGGRERTDAEYGALLDAAGFRLTRIVPLRDAMQFCVFEGVPA